MYDADLERIEVFEGLVPFAALFDEDEPQPLPRRRACKVKYDYDWRVVVARAQENAHV